MSHSDAHFDAMLWHLGAAYYETIHGDGTASGVARALESAEAADGREREAWDHMRLHHSGRWRISDVMTADVVTVGQDTPCQQVARVMSERGVNGVPVLTEDGRVAGIVSGTDLLRHQEPAFRRLGSGLPRRTHLERTRSKARSAGELMTSPAITIHPDAPIGVAARLMKGHRIRRLPVVDPAGKLIGIVGRQDLLSVFLRPDEEIAAEVRGARARMLLGEPGGVQVTVRDGGVILSGSLTRPNLIPVAERLASGVDGVVAVICELTIRICSSPHLATPRRRPGTLSGASACRPMTGRIYASSSALAGKARPLAKPGMVSMYEKLLVAVDHSKATERVLGAARELASLSHGEVWVLHLREREVVTRAGLSPGEPDDDARAEVDAIVEELTKAGITAHGVVKTTVYGYAGREIVEDAKSLDVGVIIMGSRGRGDLAGLVLGSTAHKVIHLADRPVLVVR